MATFHLEVIIKPEYACLVDSYLEEKEWLEAFSVVKPWHEFLGRKGHYHLVDAYMYYFDYPVGGYTREEFDGRTLILTGPLDASPDIETMFKLLIQPISLFVKVFKIEGS